MERRITERASLTNMNTMLTSGSLSGNVRFLHLKKKVKKKKKRERKKDYVNCWKSKLFQRNLSPTIIMMRPFVGMNQQVPTLVQSTYRQEPGKSLSKKMNP